MVKISALLHACAGRDEQTTCARSCISMCTLSRTFFCSAWQTRLAREGSVAERANRTLCALVCTGTFNATRSMEQGVPLRPHLPCLPAHRINRLVCPWSQAWIAAFCVAALAAARCPAEERRMCRSAGSGASHGRVRPGRSRWGWRAEPIACRLWDSVPGPGCPRTADARAQTERFPAGRG